MIRTALRPAALFLLPVSLLFFPPGPAGAQQQMLWEQSVGHRFTRLQVAGGSPVAIGEEGVVGFDAATGRQLWRAERGGARELLVFDVPGTRKAVVLYRSARETGPRDEPVGASYALYLYDCATGQGLWRTAPAEGDAVHVLPAPGQDRLLVLVRSADGRGTLFALALADGRSIWQTSLGLLAARPYGQGWDPARVLAAQGDRLFLLDRGERPPAVKAVALAGGELRWLAFLEGEEGVDDLHLGLYADRLYALGGRFHRLSRDDGSILWTRPEPWQAVGFREDWFLLRRGDGRRLQTFHSQGGQEGWDREVRMDTGPGSAVVWGPSGVLTGEPGGTSALIDPARGRSLRRIDRRYRVNAGRELEWCLPMVDGLVFLHAGEGGTRLWGIGPDGTDRWTLDVGNLPGIGRGPADYADHRLVMTGGEGEGAQVLWFIAQGSAGPLFTGVDLPAGRIALQLPIGATNPVFAVDPVARRLFYVDPRRLLVGAAY